MHESIICCCAAGSWAKVIAWIQIAANTLNLILLAMGLVRIIRLGPKEFAKNIKDNNTLLSSASSDSAYGLAVSFILISVVAAIIAVFMAIVLWKGSTERNTQCLRVWIYYTTFCTFWIVVSAICNTTDSLAIYLSRVILILSINSFGIYVVLVHVKEIESQNASEDNEGQRLLDGNGP